MLTYIQTFHLIGLTRISENLPLSTCRCVVQNNLKALRKTAVQIRITNTKYLTPDIAIIKKELNDRKTTDHSYRTWDKQSAEQYFPSFKCICMVLCGSKSFSSRSCH